MLLFSITLFLIFQAFKPIKKLMDTISKTRSLEEEIKFYYPINDEVGKMVSLYNNLVEQLKMQAKQVVNQEKESAWQEMAKQIAHEIRNPLTPMMLKIQYIQAKMERGEDVGDMAVNALQTILEQIKRLEQISNDFSEFSKINKANIHKINLIPLLRNIVELNKSEKVNIKLNSVKSEVYIYADQQQLVSVFNNLITNAIHATEERQEPKITVVVFEDINVIRVRIQDNGIGIPPEYAENIFKPNFTTKSSGTGLGLSISKRILDQIQATISFTSNIGKGTEFLIEFKKYKEGQVDLIK
jgi:signal transduction histidine kinase